MKRFTQISPHGPRHYSVIGVLAALVQMCRRTSMSKRKIVELSKPVDSLRRLAPFGRLPKPNNRQTERAHAKRFTHFSPQGGVQ